MGKSKLDYDKLLDDWAADLFSQVEDCESKMNQEEIGSFKYGYYKGQHDGLISAITKLSMLETRKNKKYKIST